VFSIATACSEAAGTIVWKYVPGTYVNGIVFPRQLVQELYMRSALCGIYVRVLRDFTLTPPAECVFTHREIKPGDIIIEQSEISDWDIVAIVDWERSGFYPTYWESIKMTDNLSPMDDDDDWCLYLPEPFYPHQHPVAWLLDRVLDSLEHR
jgi:hypothetical protein